MSHLCWHRGIEAPLTFSVFPWPPLSRSLSDSLFNAGYSIMMHTPTQNAPPRSFAGPGQLSVGMTQAAVFATLNQDFSTIDHALGMNNHEGGLGCNDLPLMIYECQWAKEHGLYVVDSRSSTNSQVTPACLSLGMPRKARDVFIDHQNDPNYIRGAMNSLATLARKNGFAIGICHYARPNTASVVGEMINTLRAQGIHFAFVRDINN